MIVNIGKYKSRPIILFPDDWTEGWMETDAEFGPMTAAEWREFREDYYSSFIWSCPFGHQNDYRMTPFAPWGISVHGVPKLHPDDE